MALVFRTDQSTPLTNDQLDGNFKYLRDQLLLKYLISDFTAVNISAKLNTLAVSQSTTLQLAETNAINAWAVRDLAPSSTLPGSTDKSSLVSRNSGGDITVSTVYGALSGTASAATLAAAATKLQNARAINGVSFDGTADIAIADATKLALVGGTLSGKLTLAPASAILSSINFGTSSTAPSNPTNGDAWATTSGLFFKINNITYKTAQIDSPTFTGLVSAPGYTGVADQVITISHLDAAKVVLNAAIALKSNSASPTFTGTPLAPTPAIGNSTTQIATTAFVTTAITNSASTSASGYQAYTNAAITAFSNNNNLTLALKSNILSPEFTGVPRAPTAATTDNSTQIATTAFANSAAASVQQQLNAAVIALNNAIASTRPVPVGAVFHMQRATVPYGYLEANGQTVSRTTYADLWNYLGQPNTGNGSSTFTLIDLRAEFIRGWDNGRGIDTNRVIGSSQLSDNLAHNHGSAGDDQLAWAAGVAGWPGTSRGTFQYDANSKYGGGSQIWNTTTDGGNESRPRNIALMPIIKW
jgi:hypothetical protein